MWRIALSDLNYDEREEQAVLEVLRSRWLTMGPRTEEFEARAAAYLGVRHAVAAANCTCGLELAFSAAAARLGMPDSIPAAIVPSITFVATLNAALAAGCHGVVADAVSDGVPMLDAGQVREAIARRGRPCVIVPIHYAGFDCSSSEMDALAAETGSVIVEDAAHAMGGRTRAGGRFLGTAGLCGVFSFFSNKNLATGEGGLVVTDDDDTARCVRLARSHGMSLPTYDRHRARAYGYDVLAPGHNYRCTEITAALALVQLEKLDAGNARRRELYRLYCGELREVGDAAAPLFADAPDAIECGACHILPLVCASPALRDAVRAKLGAAGIQSSHHYPPLPSFSFFGGLESSGRAEVADAGRCHAQAFASRQITLPLHPGLDGGQVAEICALVRDAVREAQDGKP